ncbi:hypothetical protein ERO13_D08G260150v2, partial [Gossypium hirsutum]
SANLRRNLRQLAAVYHGNVSTSQSHQTSDDRLPEYGDPITGTNKKEIAYNRHHDMTGEKVIHLIPVVLFLCAFTLWFFSLPADSKI